MTTLAVRALMDRIRIAAEQTDIKGFRVAYKENARGEHVVAVIWPTGISSELSERQRKRLDRMRR